MSAYQVHLRTRLTVVEGVIFRILFVFVILMTPVFTYCNTIVYGPGVCSPFDVRINVDYHVLDGTQIYGVSRSGPPDTSIGASDAVMFRGGGHIQIDGGYYRGGDAVYTSPGESPSYVIGGDALTLDQSTGEVLGGSFIGGQAISSVFTYIGRGGVGLQLYDNCNLIVQDGYFEGGLAILPTSAGGQSIVQNKAIDIGRYSQLILHGGQINGVINMAYTGKLTIYGTDLVEEGTLMDARYISGVYADGTPFSHTVTGFGAIELITIPEPATLTLLALSGSALLRRKSLS